MRSPGTLLCLASAAGFGAMGIFGKLAYDEGASVATLLAVRFAIAAAMFWLLVAATGGLPDVRRLPRRDLALALGLGAVGYAAQAGAYFSALDRIDASLLSLVLYTFPAMVAVSAIALGRARPSWRTAAALALASIGLVLVLSGASPGELDPVGAMLGLVAATIYAAYILTSEGMSARTAPLVLSALVCTGAAFTLTLGGFAFGQVDLGAVSPAGFGWLTAIALVSTVAAVALFFAGLKRAGSTAAAILSTFEPVVTVALAFAVFGESLGPAQLAGGVLVIGAVVAMQAPRRRARARLVEAEAT